MDDPNVLSQFVAWQVALLESHGFSEDTATQLRRALSAGLRDVAQVAADLLGS